MPALLTPGGHLVTPTVGPPAPARALSESPHAGPTIFQAPAKMHLQKRTPLSPLKVNGQSKSLVNTAIGGKAGFLTKSDSGEWKKIELRKSEGQEKENKLEFAPSAVVKRALKHKPNAQEEVNNALAEINHSIEELAVLLESEKPRNEAKQKTLGGQKRSEADKHGAVVEASVGFLRVKKVHQSFAEIVHNARGGPQRKPTAETASCSARLPGTGTPHPSTPTVSIDRKTVREKLSDAAAGEGTHAPDEVPVSLSVAPTQVMEPEGTSSSADGSTRHSNPAESRGGEVFEEPLHMEPNTNTAEPMRLLGPRGAGHADAGLSCDLSNTCSITERSVNASDLRRPARSGGSDPLKYCGGGVPAVEDVTLNSTANTTTAALPLPDDPSASALLPDDSAFASPLHHQARPTGPGGGSSPRRRTPPRHAGARRSPGHGRTQPRGPGRMVMSDQGGGGGGGGFSMGGGVERIEVTVSEASECSPDNTCDLSASSSVPLPTDTHAAPPPPAAPKPVPGRAGVGIKFKEAQDGSGFPVAGVVAGGPADLAGVMEGDVLMFVATNTTSPDTSVKAVARSMAEAGRNFHVVVRRGAAVLAALVKRPLGGAAQVGAAITKHHGASPRVDSVLPGSPAGLAGLRAGDVIVAVGSVCVSSLAREQLLPLLTGEPGSLVLLGLLRRHAPAAGTLWHLVRRRGGVPLSLHPPQTIEPKPCPSPSILRHHTPGSTSLRLPTNAAAGAPPPPCPGPPSKAPTAAISDSKIKVSADVGRLHRREDLAAASLSAEAATAPLACERRGPALAVPEAPGAESQAETDRRAGRVSAAREGERGGAAREKGGVTVPAWRSRKGSLQTICEDGGGRASVSSRPLSSQSTSRAGLLRSSGVDDPILLADVARPPQPTNLDKMGGPELEEAARRYLRELDAYHVRRSERAKQLERDLRCVMLQSGCTRQHAALALDACRHDVIDAILSVTKGLV